LLGQSKFEGLTLFQNVNHEGGYRDSHVSPLKMSSTTLLYGGYIC